MVGINHPCVCVFFSEIKKKEKQEKGKLFFYESEKKNREKSIQLTDVFSFFFLQTHTHTVESVTYMGKIFGKTPKGQRTPIILLMCQIQFFPSCLI